MNRARAAFESHFNATTTATAAHILTLDSLHDAMRKLTDPLEPMPADLEAAHQELHKLRADNDALADIAQRERTEKRQLEKRVLDLEAATRALLRERHARAATVLELLGALGQLVAEFHPDRHPSGLDATTVCARLNQLRDRARGKR